MNHFLRCQNLNVLFEIGPSKTMALQPSKNSPKVALEQSCLQVVSLDQSPTSECGLTKYVVLMDGDLVSML